MICNGNGLFYIIYLCLSIAMFVNYIIDQLKW